jgi:hypothetical protein
VLRWCQDWHQQRGAVLALPQAFALAKAWHGPDRRAPEWRRRTLDETERLITNLGLTEPFWKLR